MKNNVITTDFATVNISEIDVCGNEIDVYFPITTISDRLQKIIDANVQKVKESTKENWSNAGIDMFDQGLYISVKDKQFKCQLCFEFVDKEDETLCADFNIEVDLSDQINELKKIIITAMIDQFF